LPRPFILVKGSFMAVQWGDGDDRFWRPGPRDARILGQNADLDIWHNPG